ncbi:MAG: T9SS type A sorting domain-containing protein [Flavobacteriales bacterium]|nr:T9SS type A sorting domain-containing protein [Flavobacteriales bacterium]
MARNQNGVLTLEPIVSSEFGLTPGRMETFDLENDGDMDAALVADEDVGGIAVFINDGQGQFDVIFINDTTDWYSTRICAADFDNDGDNDLLLNHSFNNPIISIHEFDGVNFNRHIVYSDQWYSNIWLPDGTTAMDIDNDGLTDILCMTPGIGNSCSSCGLFWYKNLGGWQFSDPYHIQFGDAELGRPYDLIPVDRDFDGDEDLIISDQGNGPMNAGIYYFENLFWGSYRVQGHVFYDIDTSGNMTNNDIPFPFIDVQIDPTQSAFFTNANGEYNALTGIGAYSVTPELDTSLWLLTTPNSYTVILDSVSPMYSGADFGVIPNGIQPNANLTTIDPTGPCLSMGTLWFSLQNTGNTFLSGVFEVVLDTILTFEYSDPMPDSIVGNKLYYHVDSLSFYDQLSQVVGIQMPDPFWLGEIMETEVNYFDQSGLQLQQLGTTPLACAFDPNDKTEHTGIESEGYISDGQWLEYTVRFQNTGNAPATDVIIRNQLDRNLDWSTLTPVAWSHDVEISVEPDGDAVFKFLGIMLVDSGTSFIESQGFIQYRIKADSNLFPGTLIHNTANIFFDANPPISTNTTLNTVQECYQPTGQFITCQQTILISPFMNPINQQWFRNDTLLTGETGIYLEPILNGVYHVEAIYPVNCKINSEPYLLQGLAIDEVSTIEAVIYPNPSRDKVFFRLDRLPAESSELLITDVSGRLILRKRISSMQFDVSVSELGAGYFLAYINTAKRRYLLGKLVTVR